eukprot:XP_014065072.1 PREDICTED: nephronectin-like [Salmo salar]
MELWIKLMVLYGFCLGASAENDGRWPRQMASSNGLCRYGARIDCCWGWTRRSWGHCQRVFALTHRVVGRIRCPPQALCQHGCKHGDCVGPSKCKCHPGFTGKTCNQDTRTCGMANCQYGCEVLKGEVRCQCPSPGLQLAPDGRTCVGMFCSSVKYISTHTHKRTHKHTSTHTQQDGRPPVVTRKPYVPPRRPAITSPPPPTRRTPPYVPTLRPPPPKQPEPVTPVDNTIEKEVTKQRGDVHIPRNHDHNTVLGVDFDIELGNTADESKDDPEAGYLSCSFDNGLCGWIRDKDGDLHWETTPDPSGGKYLTIPEVSDKKSGRGARLVLPLTPPWNDGNLCLSFRHKLAGHHVGMLQVFVKKGKQYSPAVWGRTGGSGWRHTQITLWGTGLESVILKGERGRGRSGEMAVDDITLRKGSCTEEHNLRRH